MGERAEESLSVPCTGHASQENVVCNVDRTYQSFCKRMYHLYSDRHLLACESGRDHILHPDLCSDTGRPALHHGSGSVSAGRRVWKDRTECAQMLIQSALLGAGAGVAVVVGIFVNMDFIFPIVLIYSMMVTVAVGVLASLRFNTMEQLV